MLVRVRDAQEVGVLRSSSPDGSILNPVHCCIGVDVVQGEVGPALGMKRIMCFTILPGDQGGTVVASPRATCYTNDSLGWCRVCGRPTGRTAVASPPTNVGVALWQAQRVAGVA